MSLCANCFAKTATETSFTAVITTYIWTTNNSTPFAFCSHDCIDRFVNRWMLSGASWTMQAIIEPFVIAVDAG